MITFVAIMGLSLKFAIWAVFPAFELARRKETYFEEGMMEFSKPFWPRYWRLLRNIPEPYDPEEICRSDDGSLIAVALTTTTVGFLLVYKFRSYLVRRA